MVGNSYTVAEEYEDVIAVDAHKYLAEGQRLER